MTLPKHRKIRTAAQHFRSRRPGVEVCPSLMHSAPLRLSFLFILLLPVQSMVDFGRFASADPPTTIAFQDPGVPPPSYIYASEQLRPPYDVSAATMEPFAGCDARTAGLCAVQHSIRLVTQARWYACPDLDAGGSLRDDALATITAGNYSLEEEGASGFEIFVFSEEGEILADPIRPDLIGGYFDGYKHSGKVAATHLLSHINWVVSWGGGFVPHYSTRIDSDGTTPTAVASYIESCPGSNIRLAVSFGRKSKPTSEQCNSASNAFCAWQNVQALQGRMTVDLLTVRSAQDYTDVLWKISFADSMKIGAFYGALAQLSWIGYPGEDDLANPNGLPNSYMSQLASGGLPAGNGLNGTQVTTSEEVRDGLKLGLWMARDFARAAWAGGAVVDYEWTTAALGTHYKASLVSGVVFNQTASYFLAGIVHAPGEVVLGPLGTVCPSNLSLTCSLSNAKSLVAHARLDMLIPAHNWTRLTYNPWFGASHADAEDNGYTGFWPPGFHVKAFDWDTGICVADGEDSSNVGKTADEIFGNSEAHELFKSTAKIGGKWVTFHEGDTERLAFTVQVRKNHETFYIMSSVQKAYASAEMVDVCSSSFVEPCSIWNAEVLVSAASTELMSAADMDVAFEAGTQFQKKTGNYSAEFTGDFEVFLYDNSWSCWERAEALGMTCPPNLNLDNVAKLEAALEGNMQAWVEVTVATVPKVAFVAHMVWKATGDVEEKDLYLVTFLTAEPANDRCTSDSDCPADARCSSAGQCHCSGSSFFTNNTLVATSWGFTPSGMSCVSLTGMDCTNSQGAIQLGSCELCREGYFCAGGYPSICPAGQHCPAGVTSPLACSAGSMANTTGMSKCFLCPPGSASSQAAALQCSICLPGTFAGEEGQVSCGICPENSYSDAGQSSCTSCPGLTFSPTAGAATAADCTLCPDGYAFKGVGVCDRCAWGFTAPESDATVCRLSSELQIVVACVSGFLVLSLLLIFGANRIYKKRSAVFRQKAHAALDEKVGMALESCVEFAHPMVLMNVETFIELGELQLSTMYEGNRDANRLTYIDSVSKHAEFHASGNRIVFMSYQWRSGRPRGLQNAQLIEMKHALAQVMAVNRWDSRRTFVWVDALSVPQEHAEASRLTVDSLYSYAKASDAFLAVCCEGQDEETGEIMNSQSYQERSLCRAEVLAFCCAKGPQQVYFCEAKGLERAPHHVLEQMAHVFQGKLPCCARGHEHGETPCLRLSLVLPLLGLYIDCSRGRASQAGLDFFRRTVLPRKDHIFPKTFEYNCTRGTGCTIIEVRPLFGDLMKRAERFASPNSLATSALPQAALGNLPSPFQLLKSPSSSSFAPSPSSSSFAPSPSSSSFAPPLNQDGSNRDYGIPMSVKPTMEPGLSSTAEVADDTEVSSGLALVATI